MALRKLQTKIILLFLIAFFAIAPFFAGKIEADLIEEIEKQISSKSEQVKQFENQAKEYKDTIKSLQLKQQSLKNEIELLDAQITQLGIEIQKTGVQIDQTNLEINNIMIRIQIKEEEIGSQKKILKNLLRKVHDYDGKSTLDILLKSDELSDFFNETEYINTLGEKVKNALDGLKLSKQELETQKKELEEKKEELEVLNKKLSNQKEIVESQRTAKENLLKETRGKEYKFQDLLFNVRNQRKTILGDINRLKRDKEAEIAKIAAMAERPSENLASTSWYFSQNDPRWKDMNIGFSNSTINDYGCAIAAVAMVFKYYGIDIDPGRLSKQPIFYYDLIVWPKQWRFLDLVKRTGHKSGGLNKNDWNLIDREIASGHPVIVFIKVLRRGAGHYVVIHSKDSKGYIVHDPMRWNNKIGANIYLSTTRKYLESIYKTNTIIDQMIIYH